MCIRDSYSTLEDAGTLWSVVTRSLSLKLKKMYAEHMEQELFMYDELRKDRRKRAEQRRRIGEKNDVILRKESSVHKTPELTNIESSVDEEKVEIDLSKKPSVQKSTEMTTIDVDEIAFEIEDKEVKEEVKTPRKADTVVEIEMQEIGPGKKLIDVKNEVKPVLEEPKKALSAKKKPVRKPQTSLSGQKSSKVAQAGLESETTATRDTKSIEDVERAAHLDDLLNWEDKPNKNKRKKLKRKQKKLQRELERKPSQNSEPPKETPPLAEENAKETPASTAKTCLLYTSPSPRDRQKSRMPSSA
eukprot:TRINITY_DN17754_c0_g1_i1.p1 TRINITY_DN17754_c0_g1~~TRINITY_DN17754_c0_g1_i1.p1  ORF type:complete len:302 (+),score=81.65 TRINITY_DN17754_c0_g1_i1:68-973(+)